MPVAVVLTGGPGAGKTTVAHAVAVGRRRCAIIDVDDVRHMLVQPHVAPWGGSEGRRQQMLGVENSCALAGSFLRDGSDVVMADVVAPQTAPVYRALISAALIKLSIAPAVAFERALARGLHVTAAEFERLHA